MASNTLRHHAAVLAAKEVSQLKAERDALQSSLEQAEKRALVATRQIRSEKDRRTALQMSLKMKEDELTRMASAREHASEQSLIMEAAFERLRSPVRPAAAMDVAVGVLASEVALLEAEAEATRDELIGQRFDALERTAEVERLLAEEYASREEMAAEESERQKRAEAESGQRSAVLQARLEAAHEDAHAEGRRAAALEAALAAEVEARQRDLQKSAADGEALREQLIKLQEEERQGLQQASEAGGAMLAEAQAEAERRAREADATKEQLRAAKAALATGSHAALLLKIAGRSVGSFVLRLMLREWKATAALIEHQREAAQLREDWRATHGKLALLKEHKHEREKSLATDARRAEEEVHKKLLIAQRKLECMEDRRRFLERETANRSAEVDAVRAELIPYKREHHDDERRHHEEMSELQAEVARAEGTAMRAAKFARAAALKRVLLDRDTPQIGTMFTAWARAAACVALAARWGVHVNRLEEDSILQEEQFESTLEAMARLSHRHSCAARVQTAVRAMAHKGVVQKLERRAAVEAAAASERESVALAALREAKEELRPWPGRLEEKENQLEVQITARAREREAAEMEAVALRTALRQAAQAVEAAKGKELSAIESVHATEKSARQVEADAERKEAAMQLALRRHTFMMLRITAKASRKLRLSCAVRVWATASALVSADYVSVQSASRAKDLHGKIAALKESQTRVNEAAAHIEANAGVDERKQLALMRRKLSVEVDRRVTLTAELKEALTMKDDAVKRVKEGEAANRSLEAALETATASYTAQLAAADAKAEEAVRAAKEATERSAENERALAEAMRVRDHEESHGAFQSSLADATHNRLRAQIEQMEREVEEGAKVAAGHEALAHAEKARADRADRALALSEAAIANERARADAAARLLDEAREEMLRLREELEKERHVTASELAVEAAAERRRALRVE